MKYLSLILVLIVACAHAQDGDAVFTVSKKQAVISLHPNVDTLYNCMAYSFVLKGLDIKDIDSISFGQAKVKLDDVLHISSASIFDTVLKFYVRRQGVMMEVFNKKFVVSYCADKPVRFKAMPKKKILKSGAVLGASPRILLPKQSRINTPRSLTTITNRQR